MMENKKDRDFLGEIVEEQQRYGNFTLKEATFWMFWKVIGVRDSGTGPTDVNAQLFSSRQ